MSVQSQGPRISLLSLPRELLLLVFTSITSTNDLKALILTHPDLQNLWHHHKNALWRGSVCAITGLSIGGGDAVDDIVALYTKLAERLVSGKRGGRRLGWMLRAMAAGTGRVLLPVNLDPVWDQKGDTLGMIGWIHTQFIEPYLPLLVPLLSVAKWGHPQPSSPDQVFAADADFNHERILLCRTLLNLLLAHDQFHELGYTFNYGDVDDDDDIERPDFDRDGEFVVLDGSHKNDRILPDLIVFDAKGFVETVASRDNMLMVGLFDVFRGIEFWGFRGYGGLRPEAENVSQDEEEEDGETKLDPKSERGMRALAKRFRECFSLYSLDLYISEILRDRLLGIETIVYPEDGDRGCILEKLEVKKLAWRTWVRDFEWQIKWILKMKDVVAKLEKKDEALVLNMDRYAVVSGTVWMQGGEDGADVLKRDWKGKGKQLVSEDGLERRNLWLPKCFQAPRIPDWQELIEAYYVRDEGWFRVDGPDND